MADKSVRPIDIVSLSGAPSAPGSGFVRIYGKTDGKIYGKNDSNTEFDLTQETNTSTGALINSATEKVTPVDADMVGLMDSAASNILKKLSWLNIKATLKAYFDTLYPSGSGTSTGTNTGDNAVNSNYSGLVSNATHTGEVTGATALTLANTAISNRTTVTAATNDFVLISDTSDSNNLKKALVSDFAGSSGTLSINAQTGTTYTLVLADAGKLVRCSNAAAITLSVPLDSSVAFPTGTVISIEQQGAGIVTVTPISGVTINPTARKTWGQNAVIQLIKVGTDTWNLINGTV